MEYTFVRWPVEYGRGISTTAGQGYRQIVTDHGREGWRLVQVFAPELPAVPSYFDLIFERPSAT